MDDSTPNLTPIQRRLVETHLDMTSKVWGNDPNLYSHSVMCSVSLPLKSLDQDQRVYERRVGPVWLRMEGGSVPSAAGFQDVGLPYGAMARLLLIHICSSAVLNQSPKVEIAQTFTAFAKELGIPVAGRSLRHLREQILRLSAVQIKVSKTTGNVIEAFQAPMFDRFVGTMPTDPNQLPLWATEIEFSPRFYESLRTSAVPIPIESVHALKHSARCLDILSWLSYRLWRLKKPLKLRWTTLQVQFGDPSQDLKGFKRMFRRALDQVLLVYPQANVEVVYGGLLLKKSPPAIPRR